MKTGPRTTYPISRRTSRTQGERTGEYRTADRELVTNDEGDSYISMEDFAVALVDELEEKNAVHTYLGTGY